MTFGSPPPRRRSASAGPLCAGIDPHAALLHEWGLRRPVAGLERFALGAAEALAAGVCGREAAVGVLRALRQPRRRRPRAGHRRPPRGRRAGPARRQARRHRLDQPGLRRRLPRPRQPARRRRDHRQPVPRLRLAGPVRRHRPQARRGPVRAGPHLQQGGARGPGTPASTDGRTVTGTILDHLRALNAGAEPLGSFGAVVGATIGDTGEDFAINGPILAPGYGAQGGTAADLPRIFGAALPAVLPSSSRELLRSDPTPARCATPRGVPTTSCAPCSGERRRRGGDVGRAGGGAERWPSCEPTLRHRHPRRRATPARRRAGMSPARSRRSRLLCRLR